MTKTLRLAAGALAVGLMLAACGGASTPAKPTSVSAADLTKTGEFWNALTVDLKDELVSAGKDRLGEERSDGATQIRAVDTSALEREMDKQFTNTAKRSQTIYSIYRGANDDLAKERLDSLMGQLETLQDDGQ
jgi:hypothetical protein